MDTLGYLSDDELAAEAARWALFLVPIFATTGVNTKLLLGLELGLPVVSTVAAAAPFHLDAVRSDTGADVPIGVADTPHALARLAAHLLQNRTAASPRRPAVLLAALAQAGTRAGRTVHACVGWRLRSPPMRSANSLSGKPLCLALGRRTEAQLHQSWL